MTNLRYNDEICNTLQNAIAYGIGRVQHIPGLLERIINENMWQERIMVMNGQRVEFKRLRDFIETGPPEGLGSDYETLKGICKAQKRKDVIALIDKLEKGYQQHGGDRKSEGIKLYNIQDDTAPTGTSAQSAIRRLRKDRPDLLERVVAGELSPNAAAIEAGHRQRKAQFYPEDPEKTAHLLIKHMSASDLEELQMWLDKLQPA